MSTPPPVANNNRNKTASPTPPIATIADTNESEYDEDSIAVIRAPNESPDRRPSTTPTIEMAASCEYVDALDTEDYKRSVVLTHQKFDNSYGVLFAMIMGVPEYDTMLVNPPFSDTKKKVYTKDYRPTAPLMIFEVNRRSHYLINEEFGGLTILPKPTQWGRDKLIKWLKEHVLNWTLKDVTYIKHHIGLYKKKLATALQKKKFTFLLDETVWAKSGWDGIVPNVRLISIITSDDLKEAFIN